MREVFYFVATVILVTSAFAPEGVGRWLQYVDTARFSCETVQCWDETVTH
jgi:hypothetical protein